jgi:hypothetical protein
MAAFFAICVVIVVAGVVWFHIVRPILVDFGVIGVDESVKDFQGAMPPESTPTRPNEQAGEGQQRAGIKPPVSVPVSVSGTDTAHFDLAAIPSDLTYEEVVTILAGQITPGGKPAYSGKKIYTLVGGNYNEFTALMRRLRTKDSEPAEPAPTTTPIAGRATRATFREADPELAYNPPE